jgi:hypothetical protein
VLLEIHVLMKHAHNQRAILSLTVEHGMAGGFDLSVAGADMACVAPKVRKRRQPLERFMQVQDIFFGPGEPPLSQGGFGNGINVGVSFTRKGVASHAPRRFDPSPPSICPGRPGD